MLASSCYDLFVFYCIGEKFLLHECIQEKKIPHICNHVIKNEGEKIWKMAQTWMEKVSAEQKLSFEAGDFFNYTETHISNNFSIAFFSLHTRLLHKSSNVGFHAIGLCNKLRLFQSSFSFLRFCLFGNFSIKIQKFIGRINGKHRKSENFFYDEALAFAITSTYCNKNAWAFFYRNWNRKGKSYGHS